MRKIFPAPLISIGLWLMWLMLQESASLGNQLLALLLALLLPLMFQGLRPQKVRVRKPLTIIQLCARVVVDTTRSNINVLRFLLFPKKRRHPSGFLKIPLKLHDPNGLAVLAMIVSITPGTVWAELALDRSMLMLHVLEVDDAQAIINHVQSCYERPLMEIFE